MTSFRTLLLASVLSLACAGPTSTQPETVRVASPKGLATRSATAREDNRSGLVTRETFAGWLTDWASRRPEGITGDLVVLQPDDATGARKYLAQSAGVRAYHAADLPLLLQSRNNGVLAISRVPGNGVRADAYLRRYGIRADTDLVVFVAGTRSVATLADLARAWLTLRYWGLDHRFLAIVDGSVSELPQSLRAETSIPVPIANGDVRVPSLKRNHFSLLAHLGDVREAVQARHPILDTRSRDEFDGTRTAASALDETCLAGPPNCTATFTGRIAGARHLALERMLDPTTFAFRSLPELDEALAVSGDAVPILYDGDGTTSAIAAFTALGVVGAPVRWYAASFLEWGALNARHPQSALQTLPATSPWRTDGDTFTEGAQTWGSVEHAVRPLVFDPASPSADRILNDDLEYLKSPAPLPAPGAGDSSCLR
jgi:thiosulfate/3-mercaptopyruvate sulfurtransferase